MAVKHGENNTNSTFFFVKKNHLFIYIEIDWRRMSPPHALKSRQFAAKEK